jgi:hypothetical protein
MLGPEGRCLWQLALSHFDLGSSSIRPPRNFPCEFRPPPRNGKWGGGRIDDEPKSKWDKARILKVIMRTDAEVGFSTRASLRVQHIADVCVLMKVSPVPEAEKPAAQTLLADNDTQRPRVLR